MNEYPLHRLNTAQARGWLLVPALKREMASWLSKTYRTGCVVLSPALKAFAKVAPNGRITALQWPFKKFEFWQIANRPSLRYSECACRFYHDVETGTIWGDRDKERLADIHHPFCQSREVSSEAFRRSYDSAMSRATIVEVAPDGSAKLEWRNGPPQKRPDEWIRTAKELEE